MQERTAYGNQTAIAQVLLMGLTSHRKTQIALFVVILIIYVVTMLGNISIILLVQLDSRLHTPMYFFLSNLSSVEMGLISSIMPQMLANLLTGNGHIPFSHCAAQMYVAGALGCTEGLLLGAMAIDRYMAICRPLVYTVVMSRVRCLVLAAASWGGGFLFSALITRCILQLPFCGPNHVSHFFCNFLMVLKLVCADIHSAQVTIFVAGIVVLLVPLSAILISYGLILTSVVRMRSATSPSKAFSTCASHILVVTLFYGSLIAVYMRPRSGTDSSHDKHVAVFYVMVTPFLNPVIYTLRNKDVHATVAKVLSRGNAKHKC